MTERVRFTVDGKPASAEAGTSLLAALWNGGVRAVRRSASGESRGPLCAMGTCFECRVTVDGEAHVRSCLAPVREGMSVTLLADAHGPSGIPASPLPSPPSSPPSTPPASREPLEADVVVVGGGPAGIAAAVHAAEAGARTFLVDAYARPGGQIWRHRHEPPPAAVHWISRLERAAITRLAGATVVDAADRELLLDDGGHGRRVRYSRLVLATGARELFLPFPGWTLPGVLGVGGAQALLKAGASFGGLRVLVAGSGPLLPAVAAALAAGGARIVGIAEQATRTRLAAFGAGLWRTPRKIAEGLGYATRLAGVSYRTGTWVHEVEARDGALRATLGDGSRSWSWDCDVLACGFGLVPNLELARLLGCETRDGRVLTDPSQQTSVAQVYAAGELGGVAGVDHALTTGAIAGLAAAGRDIPPALARRGRQERAFALRHVRSFALREELRAFTVSSTLVCRCEDVALGQCADFASLRQAKLATRAGMGPCQGRVCSPAIEFLRDWTLDSTRPPLLSTPLAVLQEEPTGGPHKT